MYEASYIIGSHTNKMNENNIHYISSINTTSLNSTPVRYYLKTNNIDIVEIFISSTPWNSATCHLATLGNMGNYHITMIISLIVFKL